MVPAAIVAPLSSGLALAATSTGVSEDWTAAGALLTRAVSTWAGFSGAGSGSGAGFCIEATAICFAASVLVAGTVAEDAVVTLGALAAVGETGAELRAGVFADEVIGAGTAAATGVVAGGFTGPATAICFCSKDGAVAGCRGATATGWPEGPAMAEGGEVTPAEDFSLDGSKAGPAITGGGVGTAVSSDVSVTGAGLCRL